MVSTRRRARSLSSAGTPIESKEDATAATRSSPRRRSKSVDVLVTRKAENEDEEKQLIDDFVIDKADHARDNEVKKSRDEAISGNSSDDGQKQHENPKPKQHAKPKSRKSAQSKKGKKGNALTHLIPGYTAPMKLNTSSLDKFRPSGGIRDLQRKAERTDASTKHFVLDNTKAMQKSSRSFLPTSYAAAYSNFKRGTKRAPDTSAGKGWFGMQPSEMTEQLKTDLSVIRNRAYLDPKKFYKSADKHHSIVQVGTVIEGPTEYFSSRLTKKQRRSNITEEIMADPASAEYAKTKFQQMSREKSSKGRKPKQKQSRKFY